MKRSNRLVILVGVLLAVLAFVGIVVLFNQPGTDGEPTEPTTVEVLVAARDIAIGEAVTADMVETQEIVADAVQPGALLDISQLDDRPALFALGAGRQVTEGLFGSTGGIDIEGQLLPGEKAIAVQLDQVTGMNFLLQQGDHVDVILSLDFASGTVAGSAHLRSNDSEIVRTVKAILQNKRVLYASATNIPPPVQVDEEGNEIPVENPNVTGSILVIIAGTDADAELLKFAQRDAGELGVITMVLRGDDDDVVEPTTGVVLQDLFETYGLIVPELIPGLTEITETP